MTWDRENFSDGIRYTADQLYAARCVMADYMEAMSDGRAGCLLPSPAYRRPESEIAQIIQEMDQEWDKEWKSRGKRYRNSAEFHRLPLLAQYALVEEIEYALRQGPPLPAIGEMY